MVSQENRNYSRMSTKPVYTNNHTNTDKVIKDYHQNFGSKGFISKFYHPFKEKNLYIIKLTL